MFGTTTLLMMTTLLGLDLLGLNPSMGALLVGAGVAGGVVALWYGFQGESSNVEERLDILAGKKVVVTEEQKQVTREALVKEGVEGLTGLLKSIADRFGSLKLFFIQADTTMKVESFLMICLGSGLGGALIILLANAPLPFMPLAAIVGFAIPWVWLILKRASRFKKFAAQMPDAMELLSRALRSGHGVASAMKVVVDELPDPISKEFNIAYEEQNLGIPLEQALKNLYYRMPNLDYKFFAMAVSIQKQTGGDLAEVLDKIGKIIRERFKIMGQVQALTGEGRISGIVLMALPIALFVAVWRLNPDYVMLLFTDELGRKMIAVAIVLQILGAITIQKIIAIKV